MLSALCVFFTTQNAYAFKRPGVVKWEWLENERLFYSEPALNADFCCPEPVRYKRLQHFQKFLGEALNLACERTNNRADRNLKGKSVRYKKYWKPLKVGPRLWTFLCVWFGTAVLGITERHLKITPEWLSEVGEKKLFEQLRGGLYLIWRLLWCAHLHRDTVLFRQSI